MAYTRTIHMQAATLAALVLHALLAVLMVGLAARAPRPPADAGNSPLWIEVAPRPANEKQLPLLIQRKNQTAALQAPDRPSAISDQNRVVRRETRARSLQPLPDLGALRPRPLRSDPGLARRALRESFRESGFEQRLDLTEPAEGAENLLNTRESVYYSFYSRLYESLAPVWQSRINSIHPSQGARTGRYTTRVEAVLDAEGGLKKLTILEPSSIEAFNQAVIESWRRLPRFPNPPMGLRDSNGDVRTYWSFTVDVDANQGWNFLPPRRL